MDTRSEKQALRRHIREQLKSLAPGEKSRMDAALFENVSAHPAFQAADTVLCYVSLPFEPDTRRLIAHAWEQGKQTAFPVCTAPGEMQFYLAHSWDELTAGAYGIPEPAGRQVPCITDRTVCLVPGFAFTADGRRLGKGGGYYDRFLEQHPELCTLGLTYQFMLQEDIPCEPHDRGVKTVITDWKRIGGYHGKSGASERQTIAGL